MCLVIATILIVLRQNGPAGAKGVGQRNTRLSSKFHWITCNMLVFNQLSSLRSCYCSPFVFVKERFSAGRHYALILYVNISTFRMLSSVTKKYQG